MKENPIKIRVYGIVIKEGKILLSDEFWYDTPITKFPGGELKYGEGIIDCLKREFVEEVGVKPVAFKHFFTYESFLKSIFDPHIQIIPIYYLVELPKQADFRTSRFRFDFEKLEEGAISLRWLDLDYLTEDEMTLPSDKEAVKKLLTQL